MSLRKKPWNRVNLPVYSISSHNGKGNHNMHIITYATAISMQPKQFICGVYRGTKTLENITQHNKFVLQLLSAKQYNLVNMLGKKSGYQTNKMAYLQKRNLVKQWKDYYVLSDALAIIEMEALPVLLPNTASPDHTIFLCNVLEYKNLHTGEPLTLDILRQKQLIRI